MKQTGFEIDVDSLMLKLALLLLIFNGSLMKASHKNSSKTSFSKLPYDVEIIFKFFSQICHGLNNELEGRKIQNLYTFIPSYLVNNDKYE